MDGTNPAGGAIETKNAFTVGPGLYRLTFDLAGSDGRHDNERRLFLQQVQRAILSLPDEMRDVLLLVCVEGQSYREAAGILDVPLGTVMSRLARARQRLAEATGYKMGEDEFKALDGVDLNIQRNEYVALIGPSGSGKSTLMNLLGCLDTPSEGKYILNGRDTSTMNDNELAKVRNQEIGFIFQSFHLLPRMSVLQNVMQPLVYRGIASAERAKWRRRHSIK
ncbi:MAG: ATP-binding cassette domain-containing protein [Sphingomonadales bacterium]|nr:ATP-binding cassette domain-containing protein [Sphingomonadales bacterium]